MKFDIYISHYCRRCNAKPSHPTPRTTATKMAVVKVTTSRIELSVVSSWDWVINMARLVSAVLKMYYLETKY